MAEAGLFVLLATVGGGLGGIARFWVSGLVARRFGELFPWGTLTVNVTGSALLGGLAALLLAPDNEAGAMAPLWASLAGGVLGSYTTVSSFSLQTLALVRNGEFVRAALNVGGSLVLCLSAAALGYGGTAALVAGA
jgi:CrcB protein